MSQDTQPFDPPGAAPGNPDLPPDIYADDDQPRRGCGCWITALSTLVVFVVLVVFGLFLPPINLYQRLTSPHYTTLNSGNNAVADNGMTVTAYNLKGPETLGVTLTSVPMDRFLASDTSQGAWVADAKAAVPPALALQSPVYTVMTSGSGTPQVALSIDLPGNADTDVFDVYGWSAQTDKWTFIPAHPANGKMIADVTQLPDRVALFQASPTDQPRVLVSYDVTQVLSGDVAKLATFVAPAGLQPTTDGKLAGNLAAGFDSNAGYLLTPAIRNYADPRATDPDTVTTILSNSALRHEHAAQIAAFASSYDGVQIDYRDLPAAQRDNFTAFITDLGKQLNQAGLLLIVAVPMAQNNGGQWDTGAYDWRAIGQAASYLQIELSPDPNIFIPGANGSLEAMLRWGVGEVSRAKLLLGLSALSEQQVGSDFTPIGYDQALSALGNVTVKADTTAAGTVNPGSVVQASLDGYKAVMGAEPTTNQPYLDYVNTNNSPVARMWLTTPTALRFRMDRTVTFALAGVAFNDLMSGGVANGVLPAILAYKTQVPSQPSAPQLALQWTIQGVDGVINTVNTQLGDPLIATIQAPDGNYAINVAVVGNDDTSSQRGGAAVAVFAPTNTPTPIPTSTPTPTPRPTTAPVHTAPSGGGTSGGGGGGAPVAPAAGAIAGGFGYGGYVNNPITTGAGGAMQHAGMTWMKNQLRYSPGSDPGAASGVISAAHGKGFKILLTLDGYANDMAGGGEGYIQGFANWAGGVAALGPDAIEIWNEPNLDREWPTGQISGAAYAHLLAEAYQAIKSRNGGVMVVSAAPGPTGAEAAFPGRVENDDHFLKDFVAAGGLNSADCVGIHYNEGIVSPTQVSGDPRDNYYTRYLQTMMSLYWNIIGGQRPLCFTELGYLTPEGYGPLPASFGWAANVTVADQAAWLAQAIAIASQSGKVRLVLVWNIDMTQYGTDPMGGYAMIRPGGGCPACDALAAAR